MVLQSERNRMDQKWLERRSFEINRSVRVIYVSLQHASEHGELRDDKTYWIGGKEVAVIYFRAGYSPDHYPSDKIIQARLDMERSKAIKCPSVHYQLAGCKKVQQALANPGTLERFVKDESVLKRIRATFAGQYSLDWGPEGDDAIAMAMKSPQHFVIKPQREGGGNNLYGDDIKYHLEKIKDSNERSAYILMERIFPWPQKNHLLKVGKDPRLRDVISELGIFGVYLGSKEEEILDLEAGHLLRTKPKEDDEGGFLTGFATVDNLFLT